MTSYVAIPPNISLADFSVALFERFQRLQVQLKCQPESVADKADYEIWIHAVRPIVEDIQSRWTEVDKLIKKELLDSPRITLWEDIQTALKQVSDTLESMNAPKPRPSQTQPTSRPSPPHPAVLTAKPSHPSPAPTQSPLSTPPNSSHATSGRPAAQKRRFDEVDKDGDGSEEEDDDDDSGDFQLKKAKLSRKDNPSTRGDATSNRDGLSEGTPKARAKGNSKSIHMSLSVVTE
ncbi:hypothetical protein ONZ45_g18779 [Pleurotus djamor]|nr:hypothetical protein ONZ45_g18779 [Pleurotus djamor]